MHAFPRMITFSRQNLSAQNIEIGPSQCDPRPILSAQPESRPVPTPTAAYRSSCDRMPRQSCGPEKFV
ncbi:hypothetical protein C8Q73DRAFT_672292 [Cubamyces lactineus]|nr:hypothetical protein C8Q73DRAFT_672292 [Cubamyces lactineus]